AVRVEEAAEVRVRERPRVRRVAGPLEAVELERRERVGRRELVLDEDPAARYRHPGQLGYGELRPPHVVERPPRRREVEVAVLERQRGRVALDEGDVLRRPPPSRLEQLGD